MDSRRDFLKKAIGATVAVAATPALCEICNCGAATSALAKGSPDTPLGTIRINALTATYTKLKSANGSNVYHPPSPNQFRPIVITTKSTGPYVFSVLSAVCTHQGTTVNAYSASLGYIYCTGHGSRFDIDGNVTVGPASTALPSYQWQYYDTTDVMMISGSGLSGNAGVNDPCVTSFTLDQNFPNPFSGRTTIRFTLPAEADIKLVVSDMMGREVETMYEGALPSGLNSFTFDGSKLAPGTYFCRLITPFGTLVSQMVRN